MFKAIEGVYRDGKIELIEIPGDVREETRIIVTFLAPGYVDLRARGIGEAQAADLRARLATFAEDWDGIARKWTSMTTMTRPKLSYERGEVYRGRSGCL